MDNIAGPDNGGASKWVPGGSSIGITTTLADGLLISKEQVLLIHGRQDGKLPYAHALNTESVLAGAQLN